MKGKKCPACGTFNRISNIICAECGEDLLRVPVTEGENARTEEFAKVAESTSAEDFVKAAERTPEKDLVKAAESAPTENPATETTVTRFRRRCPRCNAVHPYQKSRCDCGMLLLTQPPFEEGDENYSSTFTDNLSKSRLQEEKAREENVREENVREEKVRFLLRSEDGRCEIKLTENADYFLGRKETGGEYLSQKSFVSSRHARIYLSEGEVILEHVGNTNPTLVNGREIAPNMPILLEPGDIVVFGARQNQDYQEMAAYFRLYAAD